MHMRKTKLKGIFVMKNLLSCIVINVDETIGKKLLLLDVRPYASYKEGVKGEQEGLSFTVLSEKMNYEKVDIKISGLLKPSFEYDGTPLPVEFDGLEGKLWQDWSNKGAVKLSLSATAIRPRDSKRIKIDEDK